MKRFLFIVVAAVVLSGVTAGCDAFGDAVAATVNGHDITFEQVRLLAASREAEAVSDDAIDGVAARGALAELIQLHAYRAELKRRDGVATAEDRDAAKQAVDALKGVTGSLKSELLTLYADRSALLRILESSIEVDTPSEDQIRARAEEIIRGATPEQLVVSCAVGVYGPADAAADVQKLIDDGADVGNPDAFTATGYAPISPRGDPFCGGVGNPDIDDAISKGAIGVVRRVDFDSQQGAQTVFLRPTGTKTYTPEDPDILAAAESQLQQEATLAARANQAGRQAAQSAEIMRRARVEIDPRIGVFDPRDVVRSPAPSR